MELQININPCWQKQKSAIYLAETSATFVQVDSKRLEWCQQFCDVKQCVLQTVRQCCPLTFVREALSHWIIQQQQLPDSNEDFD